MKMNFSKFTESSSKQLLYNNQPVVHTKTNTPIYVNDKDFLILSPDQYLLDPRPEEWGKRLHVDRFYCSNCNEVNVITEDPPTRSYVPPPLDVSEIKNAIVGYVQKEENNRPSMVGDLNSPPSMVGDLNSHRRAPTWEMIFFFIIVAVALIGTGFLLLYVFGVKRTGDYSYLRSSGKPLTVRYDGY